METKEIKLAKKVDLSKFTAYPKEHTIDLSNVAPYFRVIYAKVEGNEIVYYDKKKVAVQCECCGNWIIKERHTELLRKPVSKRRKITIKW